MDDDAVIEGNGFEEIAREEIARKDLLILYSTGNGRTSTGAFESLV
jgi:hypothetical protein